MRYTFHPSARLELNQAIDYYEKCQAGLGEEFAREVKATIFRIIQYPKAWGGFSKNTRRCLTNRFPYGLVYRILESEILIIAVMQLNREPAYWKNRISK
jgi:hypothetical protein